MSITSFRELLEGKGCRVLLGFIFLALILSMIVPSLQMFGIGSSSQGQGQSSAEGLGADGVVAEVAGYPIRAQFIEGMVKQNMQSMGGNADSFPISLQAQFFYAPAVDQAVQGAAMLAIAKKMNVKMDDEILVSTATDQVVDSARADLVNAKKLKANATQAEFEAVFKKESKNDFKAALTTLRTNIEGMLKDPNQRTMVELQVANKLIGDQFQSEVAASDDELKRRYTVFNGKRIVLDKNKNTKEDLEKIRQEILDKKMTFEAAMDKHTIEPPAKDKKKQDNVFQLSGDTAMVDPSYAEIPKLKVGDVSNVMSLTEGYVIMRFDGASQEMPKDFSTNKATYVKQYKELISARKMMNERDAILKDPKSVVWKDKSFQAMADWMKFQQDPEARKLDAATRRAKMEEFFTVAVEGSKQPAQLSQKYGAMAAVGILGALREGATPEQTTELGTRQVELYETLLRTTESPEMRIELANAYATQSKPELVAESLEKAVRGNFDYENGAALNTRISGVLTDFEKKKQISAEGAKAVRDAQRDWIKQKEEYNKSKIEFEKQQAAEKKRLEQEAAAAKKKEAEGKAKAGTPK